MVPCNNNNFLLLLLLPSEPTSLWGDAHVSEANYRRPWRHTLSCTAGKATYSPSRLSLPTRPRKQLKTLATRLGRAGGNNLYESSVWPPPKSICRAGPLPALPGPTPSIPKGAATGLDRTRTSTRGCGNGRADRCVWRFLGIIGRHPSVSKSSRWHADIFHIFFTHSRSSPSISFKTIGNLPRAFSLSRFIWNQLSVLPVHWSGSFEAGGWALPPAAALPRDMLHAGRGGHAGNCKLKVLGLVVEPEQR